MTDIEDWNIIPREHYSAKLRAAKDTPFIKVLTGIRRCGKTTISFVQRGALIQWSVGAGHPIHRLRQGFLGSSEES